MLATLVFFANFAAASVRPTIFSQCDEMTTWDYAMGMCMPRAMAGMPMRMVMVNGNGFAGQIWTGGSRGREAPAAPHMVMVDVGRTVGDRHYVNLDVMATVERWTIPKDGQPELAQIGEHNANGTPYVDAQHPHSSPLMGLTLSDTVSYGAGQDHLKFWFSPRGQSTDGPVAFMHRPTGMMMMDAPLGHHVGQDVGHVSSTVIAAQIRRGRSLLQASGFHGREPLPTAVDLPLGALDSFAVRAIREFGESAFVTASLARLGSPEAHDDLDHVWRYSASLGHEVDLAPSARLRHALILGLTNFYDHSGSLRSVGDEFWLERGRDHVWSRFEAVERTPHELGIGDATRPDRGRFVFALTLGYTRDVWRREGLVAALGLGLTETFLPHAYGRAYGETAPLSGRVFLQISGMKMWHFPGKDPS